MLAIEVRTIEGKLHSPNSVAILRVSIPVVSKPHHATTNEADRRQDTLVRPQCTPSIREAKTSQLRWVVR